MKNYNLSDDDYKDLILKFVHIIRGAKRDFPDSDITFIICTLYDRLKIDRDNAVKCSLIISDLDFKLRNND